MDKILVPVDGSKGSELALKEARLLAELNNSEVIILNVISNFLNNPYLLELEQQQEINKVFSEQAKEILRNSREFFKDYEGKVDTKVRLGDPAQEIIDEADEGNYDLVVIGNRGLNAFSRVMMGSVSNRVLNHVKTSAYIVKG